MTAAPLIDRERLRLALDAATRDLPAHERVAVAERVAREIARQRRVPSRRRSTRSRPSRRRLSA
jgi:hypothetical protein